MKQNKKSTAGKAKNNPALCRNYGIFFTLSIDFFLISLTALFVTTLYSFACEKFVEFGGALPAPTQLLIDIFEYDNLALTLSYTPFMLLLYAAEQKEYLGKGKRSALLTIPNIWKSLVIYTMLVLLSLLLPFLAFCGYINDTEKNVRYFILTVDAALIAGILLRARLRTKKNTPAE